MIIDLKIDSGEDLDIRINGKVIIETIGGQGPMGVDPDELRIARTLHALPKVIVNLVEGLRRIERASEEGRTAKQKREAFARGLLDGFEGLTLSHPMEPVGASGSVPPLRPEGGISYDTGYTMGIAIMRAAKAAQADQNSSE